MENSKAYFKDFIKTFKNFVEFFHLEKLNYSIYPNTYFTEPGLSQQVVQEKKKQQIQFS